MNIKIVIVVITVKNLITLCPLVVENVQASIPIVVLAKSTFIAKTAKVTPVFCVNFRIHLMRSKRN